MTSTIFIKINEIILSVSKLQKLVLDEKNFQISIYSEGRNSAFVIDNSSRDEAISCFVDFCAVLKQTQQEIPFVYISNVAVRLDLLNSIHVEGNSVFLSTVGTASEKFAFPDRETTKNVFEELLTVFGIGATKPKEAPLKPEDKKAKGKKQAIHIPPDKVPRKRRRT